jgi:hypothetical protein
MKDITLRPDVGVPILDEVNAVDLRDRIQAQSATVNLLVEAGYDLEVTQRDIELANELVAAFAENPQLVSERADHTNSSSVTPVAVMLVQQILQEFGSSILENAANIRNLVVNKLILETSNADPRIRIRALELLGKMGDVALFTERSEVTITHQSTDDLRAKLKTRLTKLKNSPILTRANKDGVFVPTLDPTNVLEEVGLDS